MPFTPRRFFATLLVVLSALASAEAQGPRQPFSRVAVTVTPDRADWTYRPGDPVTFRIDVLRDGHPVQGATVKYGVGPEMLPPSTEATAVVGDAPLSVAAGTMTTPGFLRLVATVEIEGRTYRGVGTAGFSPEQIQPTQTNPPDFDAFWDGERARLAALPIDARWTPLPDYGTADAGCWQVNLQNVGGTEGASRLYGILCMPKAPGKYPAVLECAGGGRAAVPRLGRTGGSRHHHAADRHSRHSGNSAAGGVRQPRPRRAQRLSHLRPRLARALLLSARLRRARCAPTISSPRCLSGMAATSESPAAARAARWPS